MRGKPYLIFKIRSQIYLFPAKVLAIKKEIGSNQERWLCVLVLLLERKIEVQPKHVSDASKTNLRVHQSRQQTLSYKWLVNQTAQTYAD